jgi:lipopolysaccharide transport system ATP-binding protein
MHADVAISIENLSKRYRRGAAAERADSLRDVIASSCRRLIRRQRDPDEPFLALDDVSLEVARGEVVGILGRNGAGKSTLLKILSRITCPSSGRAVIVGRIGSLLEVGTGFHPELTGRENIFLNGAILGMTRAEMRRKLDEIIDWSGVSAFADTPVKRFSSGMRVRLAFAVAAHLEPEILVVDEVLAVGDAEFQRKCIGKMSEVAHHGRTVLFVSHNMNALLNLCRRGVVLERGRLVFDGGVDDAVASYMRSAQTPTSGYVDLQLASGREPGLPAMLLGVGVRRLRERDYVKTVSTGDDLAFDIQFDCADEVIDVAQITLSSLDGQRLLTVGTHLTPEAPGGLTGRGTITCHLPRLPLTEGSYDVSVRLTRRMPWHDVDAVEAALRFDVESNDYFGTGLQPGPEQGPIAWRSSWALQPAMDEVGANR